MHKIIPSNIWVQVQMLKTKVKINTERQQNVKNLAEELQDQYS